MTVRLLTNIGRLWTGSEILSNAAVVTSDGRIAWVGPAAELPQRIPGVIDDIVDVHHVENLGGGLVTPGLIDAHTHPVYAGNRWAELAMRSNGSSSAEIDRAGGGVSSTVTVTRGTDPWTLCNGVRERMGRWLRSGTTTIEAALPRLDTQVRVIVPYDRGDLVARAHADGEVLRAEHGSDGTLLEARVPPGLAAQLQAAAPAPAAQ